MAAQRVESPVFVVGAERSGSTLLRLMLDHHPQLAFRHQYEFLVDGVDDAGVAPRLDAYWAYLEKDPVFRRSGLEVDRALSYPELANHFLREHKAQKKIVGGTVHRHFHRLLAQWPDARFIHLCRDPRPVARSTMSMGWAGNVWTGALPWLEAEEAWERLSDRLPPERRIDVRYEVLLANLESELRRVCAFLGVEFDPAMLRYHEDTTYEPPDPAVLERWRKQLSALEVRLIESRVGAMMTARGYSPSGHPTLRVGPLGEAALKVHDRVAKARSRVRRYGLSLWAQDFVSRRLGRSSWREQVEERVFEVDQRFVK